MRKPIENTIARAAAADHIEANVAETNGGDVAAAFTTAEFETSTARVGGEQVKLRRIVLTTEWEVAPK